MISRGIAFKNFNAILKQVQDDSVCDLAHDQVKNDKNWGKIADSQFSFPLPATCFFIFNSQFFILPPAMCHFGVIMNRGDVMNKVDFIRSRILPVFKKYNVKRAGIFGSVARGEDNIQSDVDILIELDDNLSLFDYIRMKLEIEEILGKSVDLVEYNTIKPSIKNKILEEEIRIL